LQHERSPYPQDHPLWDPRCGLEKLLSRRYFSRLWVIQELVACQRAIIRIGDSEFTADGSTMTKAIVGDRGSFRLAPWFQHLGKGSILSGNVENLLSDDSSAPVPEDTRNTPTGLCPGPSHQAAIHDLLYVLRLSARSEASVSRNRPGQNLFADAVRY
jgi:hypothetical protein